MQPVHISFTPELHPYAIITRRDNYAIGATAGHAEVDRWHIASYGFARTAPKNCAARSSSSLVGPKKRVTAAVLFA
jgi:hypothetical protein